MATPQSLNDLFVQKLKYLYDAEQRLTKVLPKLASAASAPALKQAFELHRTETETHVARLEQLFDLFGQKYDRSTVVSFEGMSPIPRFRLRAFTRSIRLVSSTNERSMCLLLITSRIRITCAVPRLRTTRPGRVGKRHRSPFSTEPVCFSERRGTE